jgi:shikimate 5-dehydrogenase
MFAALRKYHAVGFRSPQVHRDLARLQGLDILYDASCFDYDLFPQALQDIPTSL